MLYALLVVEANAIGSLQELEANSTFGMVILTIQAVVFLSTSIDTIKTSIPKRELYIALSVALAISKLMLPIAFRSLEPEQVAIGGIRARPTALQRPM